MLGIDTTFLVQAEIEETPGHDLALSYVRKSMAGRPECACLAAQVLAEFIHVTTDPRRFLRPLSLPRAIERAAFWWNAREVRPVFPDADATSLFLSWMEKHRLGRKRILDTLLGATYFTNGVTDLLTADPRDFAIFGCFRIVTPA
ncbi:MAG: type II toxin-antitoxin system VapC family toxin [Acidobacteriota bacterium]